MLKVGPYVKWKPLKSCISYKNFESLGGGGGGGGGILKITRNFVKYMEIFHSKYYVSSFYLKS